MSEKKTAAILEGLTPESVENEIVFSFVGETASIRIRFKDGAHVLPEYVVAGLGGAAAVKEAAAQLASVSFREFMLGFNQEMDRRALNDFQSQFTNSHFGRLNRRDRFR